MVIAAQCFLIDEVRAANPRGALALLERAVFNEVSEAVVWSRYPQFPK
jgi:hypothetical protein